MRHGLAQHLHVFVSQRITILIQSFSAEIITIVVNFLILTANIMLIKT